VLFKTVLPPAPAFGLDDAIAAQAPPTLGLGQGAQVLDDPITADFQAPIIPVGPLKERRLGTGELATPCGGLEILDRLVLHALIALELENIVANLFNDLFGNLVLASKRVERHDAAP
jgi:hypothetical protein